MTYFTRRKVLTGTAALAAIAAMPLVRLTGTNDAMVFEAIHPIPQVQWGHALRWGWMDIGPPRDDGTREGFDYRVSDDDLPDLRDLLIRRAREALPAGSRFEVRRAIPMTYGRSHGMAWYRHVDMDKEADWALLELDPHETKWEPGMGYGLVGRYVA